MIVPSSYHGREQAYLKHFILKHYLTRLIMIIGQSKAPVINYVDCFAGPWQDESEDLRSTSIGISLEQMEKCLDELKKFNVSAKFRALYIEKNSSAYVRLEKFVRQQKNPNIEVSCLQGDYTTLISEIIQWCEHHFTFFFIDPKGWSQIGAPTLAPLLQLPRSELLINFMYEFANRAATQPQLEARITELLGCPPDLAGLDSLERQRKVIALYRKQLKAFFCASSAGRTASVPIERPGMDRVLYFLVYLTRHPKGIKVFKEVAQDMNEMQKHAHAEAKLRKQIQARGDMEDMFADDEIQLPADMIRHECSVSDAKSYLIEKLRGGSLLIDYDCWADILEETDIYPLQFQQAMKQLIEEGRVQNLDADVRRRRTQVIKPDWRNKSERWQLIDDAP